MTEALEAIHTAVEARPGLDKLDQRMEESLKGLDVRIEQNHFIDALLPAWKLKEKNA